MLPSFAYLSYCTSELFFMPKDALDVYYRNSHMSIQLKKSQLTRKKFQMKVRYICKIQSHLCTLSHEFCSKIIHLKKTI